MSSPTCPSDPQESWTLTIGTREYFIFLEDNFILQSACELSLKTPQRELKTGSERLLWFEGLDLLLQQPSIVFLSDRLWSVSMWCGGIQMHRKSQTDTVLKPAWSEVWTLRDKIPQHTHTHTHTQRWSRSYSLYETCVWFEFDCVCVCVCVCVSEI